jgi:predicted DNA binding CopG/RHH family protein
MSERLNATEELNKILSGLSDEEQIEYLEEHGVTEEFLENTEQVRDDERPRPRSKPINIRFDDFTLERLSDLAAKRNVGYQTLLKQFVTERLYEEEKKEDLRKECREGNEAPSQSESRDWLNRVHDYLKEHQELLDEPELDSITTSRLASESASMLKELGNDINKASKKDKFPAAKLRRMVKAFNKLEPFPMLAISKYKERFGAEGTEDSPDPIVEAAAEVVEEAERAAQRA